MRLGYHTGYWSAGPPAGADEAVVAAERLGFDSVWTAEAYGSDALTPLAWWGSRTTRIRLGTAIAQISARTPTAAAMAALTLDHLSGGRFTLGLGVSGPQVVEGWYGQPYPRPLARTREYVAVVRDVLRREAPVTADGDFYPLPLPAGSAGPGWARRCGPPSTRCAPTCRSTSPRRARATSPSPPRSPTAGCRCSTPRAWTPSCAGCSPTASRGATPRRTPADAFEVTATVPVVLGDDVERAADVVRPFIALYAGGMGARGANFHRDALDRLGYGEACDEIQAHYLAGRRAEAAAAVPLELVQDVALVGPPDAIRARLPAWRSTAVTTLLVQTDPRALAAVAEVLVEG